MFSPLIRILLALIVFLALILVAEWFWLTESGQHQRRTQKPLVLDDIQLPQLDFAEQTLENHQSMLSRPLFIQGRRPLEDRQQDETPESSADIDEFSLMGVYQVDDKSIALLKDKQQEGPYLKKTEGETVAGWEIKQILPDRIVVERSGDEKTVDLRKPKPKTARISAKLPKPHRPPRPARRAVQKKSKSL